MFVKRGWIQIRVTADFWPSLAVTLPSCPFPIKSLDKPRSLPIFAMRLSTYHRIVRSRTYVAAIHTYQNSNALKTR